MEGKTCCFIGHRFIYDKDKTRQDLLEMTEALIDFSGFTNFLIGHHGDFDKMALSVCRELKVKYPHIRIYWVLTSFSVLKNKGSMFSFGEDIETMFYPIEDEYFKNRITMSNKYMINDSLVVVAYVDKLRKARSGAKKALNYAIKEQKLILNLFEN